MYTNFLRTGVGVESIDHLYDIQNNHRQIIDNKKAYAFLTTRRTPTRFNDLINGGSVYWIIKQQICVRQSIIDVQTLQDEEQKNYCLILMDKDLILTSPVQHRHIQGWRYLAPEKAPSDLRPYTQNTTEKALDPNLAKQLADAGLL